VTDQLTLVGNTGGGSFAAQLPATLDAINAGATQDACGRLNGYLNHVSAQSGKQLSTDLADELTANVAQIQSLLGC